MEFGNLEPKNLGKPNALKEKLIQLYSLKNFLAREISVLVPKLVYQPPT